MTMKLQKSVRLYADRHFENLGNIFTNLYKDSLLTDCTLYCKDGSLKAHKVILAASSRYFRQVFIDHTDDNAIFMYGISYSQLKNLVELIYRGSIDIPNESFDSVYGLCEELKVTGVNIESSSTEIKTNGAGRDTRYKGQKRVAVDFESKVELRSDHVSIAGVSAPKNQFPTERRNSSSSDKSLSHKESENDTECEINPKEEPSTSIIDIDSINEGDNFIGHEVMDEQGNLSVWARKERKFKCDLCPSSFKRASHLNRHQLVHTGERPFACEQCDKAFSRHDKLKHHVHKAHELGALNEALGPDSLYTIDRVDILTPETEMVESENTILTHHDQNVSSVSSASPMDFGEPPQKRRGRPRKYPAPPKPLIKRPRGRPRINPVVARPLNKRPRGRPRINPMGTFGRDLGSYQYHADVYDDIGYHLPKSHQHPTPSEVESSQEMIYNSSDLGHGSDLMDHEQGIMEPLVEIKTENTDSDICNKSTENEQGHQPTSCNSFFENIGLFENTATIAKIGECTISVATSSGTSASNVGGTANN